MCDGCRRSGEREKEGESSEEQLPLALAGPVVPKRGRSFNLLLIFLLNNPPPLTDMCVQCMHLIQSAQLSIHYTVRFVCKTATDRLPCFAQGSCEDTALCANHVLPTRLQTLALLYGLVYIWFEGRHHISLQINYNKAVRYRIIVFQ